MKEMITKLVLLGGILTMSGSCIAHHTTEFYWMGYCCGRKDCAVVDVAIVEFGQVDSVVLIGDTPVSLPSSAVHESQDGHTYWCRYDDIRGITRENTRCVFYTVGG